MLCVAYPENTEKYSKEKHEGHQVQKSEPENFSSFFLAQKNDETHVRDISSIVRMKIFPLNHNRSDQRGNIFDMMILNGFKRPVALPSPIISS